MTPRPQDRRLRAIANTAKRERRIPPGAMCDVCDAREQLSLGTTGVRCYEHASSDGNARIEADHWAGRHNVPSATIRLRGNAHRGVTEMRRLMGIEELPLPAGDALLLLSHLMAGVASLLLLFAKWLAAYATARSSGREAPPFPVVP